MDPVWIQSVLVFLWHSQHLDVRVNDVRGKCLQIECLKACFSGFGHLSPGYWTWPGRVSKEKEAKDRDWAGLRDILRFGLPTCC